MKNRFFSILLLLCTLASIDVKAQSDSHNYIVKYSMLDEQGRNSLTTIEYYDGLGRKEQVIGNGVKPEDPSKSLLSRTIYDDRGNEWKKFLPVPANSLEYQTHISCKYDDQKALSVITYDALDRPIFATTPGNDMGGLGRKHEYLANKANSVKKYVVADDGSLALKGYYPEGALSWERFTDEDNNVTDIYTNLLGQKVLERHDTGKGTVDTYFVYNDCSKLCFVLQPMYQHEADIDKYVFRYKYDQRGRMTEKIIPGCEKITYTYDKADRLLTMQDGEMRKKGLTRHYTYDGFGRISLQTLYHGNAIHSVELRNYYDGDYSLISDYSNTLTAEARKILTYSGDMGITSAQRNEIGKTFTCVQTQLASDGTEIVTAMYYDQKGRIVEKNSKLLDKHLRREQTTYTFTGKVLVHTIIDYNGAKEVFRSTTTNNYDAATGILTSTDVVTSNNEGNDVKKKIATYEYDDYGRICSNTHGSAIQKREYDVRDWPLKLTSANFNEDLVYNRWSFTGNVNNIFCTGPYYDYCYEFEYDELNRLVSADYFNYYESELSLTEPLFNEYASYDDNGNITHLQRTGFPDEYEPSTLLDDLDLSYNGNQLSEITDKANDITYMTTTNFIQNGKAPASYTYNVNGAMETDANDGVVFMEYDNFGYAKAIYFKNGCSIKYVHTPTGEKLKETYTTSIPNITKPVGLPFSLAPPEIQSVNTKDYWGTDIICKNGNPQQFFFDGGFADIKDTDLTWHYYVKDHLGSNRIVQDEQGKVEATYNFYPFGGFINHFEELYTHNIFQPFTFQGKEYTSMYGLGMFDFGARLHAPLIGRWTSVDQLSEKYYSWSPYAFCLDNPLKFTDQNGKETHVALNTDGTYRVLGGILNKDRNIYLYSQDNKGKYTIKGKSIGKTTSTTSFYNSDSGKWAIGAIINPYDNSGKEFLAKISSSKVTLGEYMDKARNGHPYDFKVTNGGNSTISNADDYKYRGMNIGSHNKPLYSSARDIGNMAAGIVAAKNGIPWSAARIAFDAYQSRNGLQLEGISTRNAEYYGWSLMNVHSNGITEAANLTRSINSCIQTLFNSIFGGF